MQIIHIGRLVWGDQPTPETPEAARTKHDAILAALDAPVYLGSAKDLNYDHKSDRYTAHFTPAEGKALKLKTTGEVAAFVAEHIAKSGYWLGRVTTGGELADAYLIQQ
jgi:hypothetical protein